MKKLKIILNSNVTYIVLITITIINTLVHINLNNQSRLDSKIDCLESKIIDYKINNEKLSITIQNEEKISATYYIKDQKEYNRLKESIKYGITIKTNGKLSVPEKNTMPYAFNYQKYLHNRGIQYIQSINSYEIINNKPSIMDNIRNIIYSYINKIDKTGYIKALVLSDKNDIELYDNYQKIGASHLFAISGMHIFLLSKIIYSIIKNKYKKIILIIIILLYSIILSFPISLTRCLVFIVIEYTLSQLNVNISSIRKLTLTMIIILLLNYQTLYKPSFYYSFITVYGLYISKDFLFSSNKLIASLKLSLITFLFSLPLSLFFYYQANFLSIIYNLIYIPLVSLIIYPLILISIIFPFISPLLELIINITEHMTTILSNINTFTICIGINTIEIIIYCSALIYILVKKKYTILYIPLLVIFIIYFKPYLSTSSTIIFFDVSQGDSALIITQHRKDIILIDTGGTSNYNISKNIIAFLHHEGISRISTLILTHGDYDHMGEATNLVENFKVEKVIFNCGEFNNLEQELIELLNKKKIPYYSCIKELNIDNNKFYFLQTKEYDNENDNSNVIYTEIDGYKFMFMGDASINTEKEIIDKYNLPDIDVLKVGHHGSRTSSGKEFIEAINPNYSIIPVGKNNRYGHPNKEVINNLEDSKIYRTDIDGSIMFKIKNNKLKIDTCSP